MNAIKTLKRHAIRAHRLNWTWAEFWKLHGDNVRAAEPYSRANYHRLVRRLLALVTSGDTDGLVPIGTTQPWEADDAAPNDVGTQARCLIELQNIPGLTTADQLEATHAP